MSDPSARPPYRGAGVPVEYPYGGPVAADPALLVEPGSGRPTGEPPVWTPPPMAGYPPPGQLVPGFVAPGFVPVPPERAAARAQALAALIVSVLLVIPCFAVWALPAVILSALALGRARYDLPLARVLTRVSWIWVVVSVALWVAFIVWSISTSTPTPHPS